MPVRVQGITRRLLLAGLLSTVAWPALGTTPGQVWRLKAGIGYGPAPPPPVSPAVEDNVAGVCYFHDGKAYDKITPAQKWLNQVAAPADGSGQTDSDVYLGAGSGSGSDDPTYVGDNHWEFNGSKFFSLVAGANPTLVSAMHKGSQSWSFLALAQTGPGGAGVALFNGLAGTANAGTDFGWSARIDSTGAFKVDQMDGAGVLRTKAINGLLANTVYTLAAAYDAATNTLSMAVNTGTWTTFSPSGWTVPNNSPATSTLRLAARGANGLKAINGCKLYGMVFATGSWTNAQLAKAVTWITTWYSPLVAVVPSAPIYMVLNPGDQMIGLAWVVAATGGAILTDHLIEYRVLGSGGAFSSVNTGSGRPDYLLNTGLANGNRYEVKVTAINSVGSGPTSAVFTTTETTFAAGTPPYDISSQYKITYPVDAAGNRSGTSVDVSPPIPYSAWFMLRDSEFNFMAPDGGATTSSNAFACRAEFRDLTDRPFATPDGPNPVKLRVMGGQAAGDKVIVHQIHGSGSGFLPSPPYNPNSKDDAPWIKVVVQLPSPLSAANGKLYAIIQPYPFTVTQSGGNNTGVGPTTTITGLTNVSLGDILNSSINWDGTNLTWSCSKDANPLVLIGTVAMHRVLQWYWKRGNYYQSTAIFNVPPVFGVAHVKHRAYP